MWLSPVSRSIPLSRLAAICDLEDAWLEFVLEVAYALKVDKLCDWLASKLRRDT
jgi:hypothetical protein